MQIQANKITCTVLLVLTLIISISFSVSGQDVRITSSNEQHWYGGIAGHSGVNYMFTFEFTGVKPVPHLQSIWIGNEEIEIVTAASKINTQNINTTISKTGSKLKYIVKVGTFKIEEMGPSYPFEAEKLKKKAPIAYKGIALLRYTYNGSQRNFVISKINDRLPDENLP